MGGRQTASASRLEYLYKDNNYKTTTLGRTGDTRNEVFVNLTYGTAVVVARDACSATTSTINYDSYHRNVGVGSCDATTGAELLRSRCAAAVELVYNWSATVKNNNWMIGLGGDWPVSEKFMLTGSIMYEEVERHVGHGVAEQLRQPAAAARTTRTPRSRRST